MPSFTHLNFDREEQLRADGDAVLNQRLDEFLQENSDRAQHVQATIRDVSALLTTVGLEKDIIDGLNARALRLSQSVDDLGSSLSDLVREGSRLNSSPNLERFMNRLQTSFSMPRPNLSARSFQSPSDEAASSSPSAIEEASARISEAKQEVDLLDHRLEALTSALNFALGPHTRSARTPGLASGNAETLTESVLPEGAFVQSEAPRRLQSDFPFQFHSLPEDSAQTVTALVDGDPTISGHNIWDPSSLTSLIAGRGRDVFEAPHDIPMEAASPQMHPRAARVHDAPSTFESSIIPPGRWVRPLQNASGTQVIGRSPANNPSRKDCGHDYCQLSLSVCCSCSDHRPDSTEYSAYIDGRGWRVGEGSRDDGYCSACRGHFNVSTSTSVTLHASEAIPPTSSTTQRSFTERQQRRREFLRGRLARTFGTVEEIAADDNYVSPILAMFSAASSSAPAAISNPQWTTDEGDTPSIALLVDNTCKVCFSRHIETLFLPCAHLVCCGRCASLVASDAWEETTSRAESNGLPPCPVCRSGIEDVLKVFRV